MTPESYEEELENLSSEYSDTYKDVHGIRPRQVRFGTVDEAEAALESLYADIESDRSFDQYNSERLGYARDFDLQTQELQSGTFDREDLSKQSGMGRRSSHHPDTECGLQTADGSTSFDIAIQSPPRAAWNGNDSYD